MLEAAAARAADARSDIVSRTNWMSSGQVWLAFQGREYSSLQFKTPFLYSFVRHPLYVGWLIAFWATPTMSVSHLVFAIVTTGYILVAIQWEERDLVQHFGETYLSYKRRVPMLIPRFWSKRQQLKEA